MPRARTGSVFLLLLVTTAARAADAPLALTLERIVSRRPALSGTAPAEPTWSPDGKLLAFLWNDRGLPERQVWVVGRDGSGLRRLTEPRSPGGVSEVAWLPGPRLLYLEAGEVRRIPAGGGKAQVLAPAVGERSVLSVSPDGRTAAWVEDGDLVDARARGWRAGAGDRGRGEGHRSRGRRLRPPGRRAGPQRVGRGARSELVPGRPVPRAAVHRPPRRPHLPHPRLPRPRGDAGPRAPRRAGTDQRPPHGGAVRRDGAEAPATRAPGADPLAHRGARLLTPRTAAGRSGDRRLRRSRRAPGGSGERAADRGVDRPPGLEDLQPRHLGVAPGRQAHPPHRRPRRLVSTVRAHAGLAGPAATDLRPRTTCSGLPSRLPGRSSSTTTPATRRPSSDRCGAFPPEEGRRRG